jgi:hypothetical protein
MKGRPLWAVFCVGRWPLTYGDAGKELYPMGIQAIVSSLDDVQGEVKSLYKEQDGKFVLDIDGLDDHPTVRGVITANKSNKEKRDAHKAELDQLQAKLSAIPEDFDPEAYQQMKEQIEKGTGPDVDERLAKQRAKLEEKFNAEINGREEKIGKLDGAIRKMIIDDGLSRAMDDASIDPVHKSKLLPYLKTVGKLTVEADGDAFKASVDTDLGPIGLKQFVADWAETEDGKLYVAKSTGPKPRGGEGGTVGGTITRTQFDAMSHSERAKNTKDGVKVVDG